MSEPDEVLRDTCRAFFANESPPSRVRAAEDATPRGFDAALWAKAAALGVPGLVRDGASRHDLAIIAEESGRVLAPIPLVESLVAARLLMACDTDPPDGLVTVAVRPAEQGLARLVPAGAIAEAVLALDGDELVLARGVRPAAVPVLGGAPVADRRLDDRTVLARGADARAAFARAVDEWRLLTASALVGLAAGALDLGVAYAKARRQFGSRSARSRPSSTASPTSPLRSTPRRCSCGALPMTRPRSRPRWRSWARRRRRARPPR
jgi:alkylation response protein AidB-like acyl-CoA dehydrogenase